MEIIDNMNKLIVTIGTIFLFLSVSLSGCNETTQKSEVNVNSNIFNPFNFKTVIIRDDDIGSSSQLPSVEWISNLAINNDFKITFAVIPTTLFDNFETIEYLNQLDKNNFEFAMHGYKHEIFQGLPFEEQYSLIENGTKILEESLHYKLYTFIPPYGSSDVNTTKALNDLGYHSITDMRSYPCYVVDFVSDFAYETGWNPIKHCSFEELKSSFDTFYNSSDEYFIVFLHDWTFLDDDKKVNETKADVFEKGINYIKTKNVQFMTIEEAYERQIDENVIKNGMINESSYFIDLRECSYNHTIKINPPSSWEGNIYLIDETTGQQTLLDNLNFEFKGIKGHFFYINHIL